MTAPAQIEAFRADLTGYCYRMLGSPFDAEDAVQATFERAMVRADQYDPRRGSVRNWLYTMATSICLDMARATRRRALPADLGPAAGDGVIGPPLPESVWVQPAPDSMLGLDPADTVERRDSVRLAFVAALQILPPRQRAVLLLRDVLCWQASEVAELLGCSTAAVNSALQRARAALPATVSETHIDTELLARYCDAFERHDVDALVALLHEDATMSMPPFGFWLCGRDAIAAALRYADACERDRLVPIEVNGRTGFAQYRSTSNGCFAAFAIVLVESDGERITAVTSYLNPDRLFPMFGLSAVLR